MRKYGSLKVALILDNCPAHQNIPNIPNNVKLVFLPPNLTALHQPADQGMIAQLKLGYKFTLQY